MPQIIAMAGKGGTGKTTLSALLLKYLIEKGMTPVLAVDADPNANLNELLGLKVGRTVSRIRKDLKGDMPPNMTRDKFMEMQLHQALIEERGYDLLVMGQPDGPGCYCAANQHLAATMEHLVDNYKFLLVDNEAGMEHLSRMNLRHIDYLLVLSDPSARGILTARRIAELVGPLGLEASKRHLIINRAPDPAPAELLAKVNEAVEASGMPLAGILPASGELVQQELAGASYLDLAGTVPILTHAFAMFDRIFNGTAI